MRHCLVKDPKERLRDIGDVRLAMKGTFETTLSTPSEAVAAPTLQVWQRPVPVALAVLAALVITGLAVWNLKPREPRPVSRFNYDLPKGHQFRNTGRPVIALSADGSQFVYSNTAEGLYLRSMAELDARLIPGTEESLTSPIFSPDGRWVGYYQNGQLKKIDVSGGTPVILCEATNPFGVNSGRDDTILFGQREGIMRVSANGGTPELVVATEGEQVHGPELLPGGEWVLFTLTRASGPTRWDEAEIVVQSLESGERRVVWTGGSDARYVSTGHLVYALDDDLFAVRFDLDALEVRGGPVSIVEGVQRAGTPGANTGSANFSFSDQGSLVYVSGAALSTDRTLALVGRNGVVEPLSVPPAQYLTPRLAPDGGKLVVQTVEDERNVLWIYDLSDDTQIQQLTFEGDNHRPVWTPDSQRITFSSDRDGTMSLYWMPADGSGAAERLTTAEEGTFHWVGSWSPDGETLLFNVQRELTTDWDIWTLSGNGRETHSLYDTPDTIYLGAELSPNGEWLAYGAGPSSGDIDIYVEPFPPTGSRRRISQNGGYWPLWSRDGDRLFYRPASTTARTTLRSVDIVTEPGFAFSNEQRLAIEGFIVVGYYRDYDITPDGERLVMVFPADQTEGGETSRPQVNIVLNWFEELKERVPVP